MSKLFATVEVAIEYADQLRDAGELGGAEEIYRALIKESPLFAFGHYKLGVLLGRALRFDEAESAYREALRLAPTCAEAANNLGLLLLPKGHKEEAERWFRIALAEQPDFYAVLISLGNILLDTGRKIEALHYFRRALALRSDLAFPHQRVGEALRLCDRLSEAIGFLEEAVRLDPSLASAWNSLGSCHLNLSNIEKAIECYRRAIEANPDMLIAYKNAALAMNYVRCEKADVLAVHKAFEAPVLRRYDSIVKNDPFVFEGGHRRLRIGFISGDFRVHSVSYFTMPLLKALNHRDFELHAFFTAPSGDYRTSQMQVLFHRWHPVHRLNTEELLQKIRSEKIDILFELSGHTNHSAIEVMTLRAAPVQVSWIGYPNTTGIQAVDYRLTDAWADPQGIDDCFYTEKLIRLPTSFLCYAPHEAAPEVGPLPLSKNGYVTFGSFNQRTKLSNECIALWAKVMLALPNSRLLLKSVFGFGEEVSRQSLLDQFSAAGVATERVTLLPVEDETRDHLARYSDIDIALDTLPYNGTTTTCEALWMGVPVVTLTGDRHASRVGTSLLQNCGLPWLIASTEEAYINLVTELASDVEKLKQLRMHMRENLQKSALFDSARMARDIERFCQQAWTEYVANNKVVQHMAITANAEEAIRIVIGGEVKNHGWLLVGAQQEGDVDVIGTLLDLSFFGDESCTEIYCAHQLQRLSTGEVLNGITELYRVLQPGGRLYLSVPDLEMLSNLFLDPAFTRAKKFQVMRQIYGAQHTHEEFNQTGFSFEFLTDYLADVGFTGIEHVESFGMFDDKSEQRIDGALVSLNLIVSK